eukprot:4668326-Ditylum_brightwellii.AAC.1
MIGPTETDYPVYFHQPMYYNGDDVVYSQQDNSNVEFTVDGVNANYNLIDKEWMDANGVSSLQ